MEKLRHAEYARIEKEHYGLDEKLRISLHSIFLHFPAISVYSSQSDSWPQRRVKFVRESVLYSTVLLHDLYCE